MVDNLWSPSHEPPMLGAHDWGGSVAGTGHSDKISENGMEGGREAYDKTKAQ